MGVAQGDGGDCPTRRALVRREREAYPASPPTRRLIKNAVRDRFRDEQVEAEGELIIEVAMQVRERGSGRPGCIGARGKRGVQGSPTVPAHIHLLPPGALYRFPRG